MHENRILVISCLHSFILAFCWNYIGCSKNKWRGVTILLRMGGQGQRRPHSHQTPHPTPFPTQTHTQKASKTLIFPLFDSCSRTDRHSDTRMDQRTDKVFYRVACPQLKTVAMTCTAKNARFFFFYNLRRWTKLKKKKFPVRKHWHFCPGK